MLESAVNLRRDWDGNEEVTKIEGGFKKRIKKWYADRYAEKKGAVRKRRDIVGDYI